MRLWPWIAGLAAGSAAWLVYGALVDSKRLVVERKRLPLPGWPEHLDGFKVALIGDLHLRDIYSLELAHQAIEMALEEGPDFVVLAGDLVGYWKPESQGMLEAALEPLIIMNGACLAVPGNHDYWAGDASRLAPVLDGLNIKFLRNQTWTHSGIRWIGIDSLNAEVADPIAAIEGVDVDDAAASIVVWHEPDAVDLLPYRAHLMLAGHSHGGQWIFPGGFQPMSTKNGEKYVAGFYPETPTPLYVTRGVGTTGPPARFGALPEVSLLTLGCGG